MLNYCQYFTPNVFWDPKPLKKKDDFAILSEICLTLRLEFYRLIIKLFTYSVSLKTFILLSC